MTPPSCLTYVRIYTLAQVSYCPTFALSTCKKYLLRTKYVAKLRFPLILFTYVRRRFHIPCKKRKDGGSLSCHAMPSCTPTSLFFPNHLRHTHVSYVQNHTSLLQGKTAALFPHRPFRFSALDHVAPPRCRSRGGIHKTPQTCSHRGGWFDEVSSSPPRTSFAPLTLRMMRTFFISSPLPSSRIQGVLLHSYFFIWRRLT